VAFQSYASNLVSGDTNVCFDASCYDIFVRDLQTGTTTRVSVSSSGAQGDNDSFDPSISDDGRYVAFWSAASNLVAGDTYTCLFNEYEASCPDVFVHDRQAGTTSRVSVDSAGAQADGISVYPAISGDGRYVTFSSAATNLVAGDTNTCLDYQTPGTCPDVFVHDRQAGTTEIVSVGADAAPGNGLSAFSVLSGDGRYVAFRSDASNFVAGDTLGFTDVFVRDRQAGTTERVSVSSSEAQANDKTSFEAPAIAISRDGRYVTFFSAASNLVPNDTNTCYESPPGHCVDVFLRDRQAGTTERISVSGLDTQANEASYQSAVSDDGAYVVFDSYAASLVAGDTNGASDIFIRIRGAPAASTLTPLVPLAAPEADGAAVTGP